MIGTGVAEYFAENPPRIWSATTLPRALLQCLFLSLLGKLAGGQSGEKFAYIGSTAVILTLSTMVSVCDLPMAEKLFGTAHRLQLGIVRPSTTLLLRSTPWVVEGVLTSALAIAMVGGLLGQWALAGVLLRALPCYALMALTSIAAGSAAASFAVGRRADVLVGNAFAYLTMVATGALIPPGRVPVLEAIGALLPLHNGVLALRALTAGQPWMGRLAAEAAVGLGWAVIASAAYTRQFARSRRLGTDAYA